MYLNKIILISCTLFLISSNVVFATGGGAGGNGGSGSSVFFLNPFVNLLCFFAIYVIYKKTKK